MVAEATNKGGQTEGDSHSRPLEPHEELAVEAIGNVIEAWGFKRNQGRVWALLYLRGGTFSAKELRLVLDLSKGAISLIVRELERWGVVIRVRGSGAANWSFKAETDLMRMIGRVVREREGAMLAQVRTDLESAYEAAQGSATITKEQLRRLGQLRLLAKTVERAVRLFLDSARPDVSKAFDLLAPIMQRKSSKSSS